MKIVKPSATLLSITPNAEQLIERAGRTCYKSEDMITEESASKFIEMIVARKHFSVLEHASASILFVCDRGVSHEIVRHRLSSYSQESTRYCNYNKEKFGSEITVIEPPGLNELSLASWVAAMNYTEMSYECMIKSGCSPQIARSVLPNSLKTEIVMTANFREWLHFFSLRCAHSAHPQMIEVAEMARDILVRECPSVFKSYVPPRMQTSTV